MKHVNMYGAVIMFDMIKVVVGKVLRKKLEFAKQTISGVISQAVESVYTIV